MKQPTLSPKNEWQKELNAILISGKHDINEPVGYFHKRIRDLFAKVEQRARNEEREKILKWVKLMFMHMIEEELKSLTPPTTNERKE